MTTEYANGSPLHTYTYDGEGMTATRISYGVSSATYYYDADGSLVRKAGIPAGQNTTYVGDIYENLENVPQIRKYYFLGGMRVAMRSAGTLFFLTGDQLGSTSLVTDSAGMTVGTVKYYPYGPIRTQTGTIPTDKLFTGQQRETTNGIYHYNARLYNSDIGRMPQADTVIQDYEYPGDYNHYSYVRNNPTNHRDPTGHGPVVYYVNAKMTAGYYDWNINPGQFRPVYRLHISGYWYWDNWSYCQLPDDVPDSPDTVLEDQPLAPGFSKSGGGIADFNPYTLDRITTVRGPRDWGFLNLIWSFTLRSCYFPSAIVERYAYMDAGREKGLRARNIFPAAEWSYWTHLITCCGATYKSASGVSRMDLDYSGVLK